MNRITASLAILVCCFSSRASSQPAAAASFANTKLYEAVLNHLFPREIPTRTTETVLRYTYCDNGEMQISITEANENTLSVHVWAVPRGSPTVWNQVAAQAAGNPERDAEQLGASIPIERRSLTVQRSSSLARLMERARPQMSLGGTPLLFLEGSQYELAIQSLSKQVAVTIRGPQEPASSTDPLVRWMGRVRTEIERHRDGA
jgi:hypothetical protein